MQIRSTKPGQSCFSGQQSPSQWNASNDFLKSRGQVLQNNRNENSIALVKLQEKEGIDILRLEHPPLDQLNDDFLCGICQSKF